MAIKSKDANRLNAENDEQYQKQQVKIRKELQEAANEHVEIKLRCSILFIDILFIDICHNYLIMNKW